MGSNTSVPAPRRLFQSSPITFLGSPCCTIASIITWCFYHNRACIEILSDYYYDYYILLLLLLQVNPLFRYSDPYGIPTRVYVCTYIHPEWIHHIHATTPTIAVWYFRQVLVTTEPQLLLPSFHSVKTPELGLLLWKETVVPVLNGSEASAIGYCPQSHLRKVLPAIASGFYNYAPTFIAEYKLELDCTALIPSTCPCFLRNPPCSLARALTSLITLLYSPEARRYTLLIYSVNKAYNSRKPV